MKRAIRYLAGLLFKWWDYCAMMENCENFEYGFITYDEWKEEHELITGEKITDFKK